VAVAAATEARAYVPPVGKIAGEVARANRKAGRDRALVLSVALRGEGGRTLGQGELLSDPRGLARLELTGSSGEERHLLRGGEHRAARGGSLLSGPAPWLPPLYLLQTGSGERLLSALLSLGASPTETVLGRLDETVCYVLGGRDLAPPANESAALVGSPGPKAAVWVERESFGIVRIDLRDGTRFVLGPPREHADVTLPEWIAIERPGVPPTRLEILDARSGRFDPAVTFGDDWLLGR